METAFQADAFQFDVLAFQINVVVPATDTTPARTAAGGPTGVKHRKRYLFPTPEEVAAEEKAILAAAIKSVVVEEEEDDEEMISAMAAFLANEDWI